MIFAGEREGMKKIEDFDPFQPGTFYFEQRERVADIADLIEPKPDGRAVSRLLWCGSGLQIDNRFLCVGQFGLREVPLPVDVAIDDALLAGGGPGVRRHQLLQLTKLKKL